MLERLGRTAGKVLPRAALLCAAAVALPTAATAIADVGGVASSATLLERLSSSGFFQAFSLIFVSEIGDKTFFIAGLLAMKTSRLQSFIGSILALAVMTLISVALGQIFHNVPSTMFNGLPIDDYAAIAAFTFFGLKTLITAFNSPDGNEGVEDELKDAKEAVDSNEGATAADLFESIASTFALVFAAEFGDRSFLSTIALSAAQNPVSVAVGAIGAHAAATLIAVAGGAYIAKYISEKVIGYIAGTLFLVFAATTALGIF